MSQCGNNAFKYLKRGEKKKRLKHTETAEGERAARERERESMERD